MFPKKKSSHDLNIIKKNNGLLHIVFSNDIYSMFFQFTLHANSYSPIQLSGWKVGL